MCGRCAPSGEPRGAAHCLQIGLVKIQADGTIEVDIALPPLLAGYPSPDGTDGTRRQAKDALRVANADGARDLARLTGQTHAQVNGQLNRMVGIRSINDATVEQLQARLSAADRWFERLRG